MKLEVHQLRVNVKSLASEARILRQEMAKAKDPDVKASLACHRSTRIRPEARLAHLSLAYVKGVPYKKAESKTNSPISVQSLYGKLNRFISLSPESIERWVGAE